MTAYYNEIDPYAAQWLRNLIAAGAIAPGDVDERSIVDVRAGDLAGYDQCHFFAGIGHLWPDWFKLIRECRPVAIFGEQVATSDGLAWLDIVQSDLENAGYASGAVDLCAAGVGAPHIRQRLWFMAYAMQPASKRRARGILGTQATLDSARLKNGRVADGFADGGEARELAHAGHNERAARAEGREHESEPPISEGPGSDSANVGLADADEGQRGRLSDGEERECDGSPTGWIEGDSEPQPGGIAGELGNACGAGLVRRPGERGDDGEERALAERTGGPVNGFWRDAEWISCTDGKARPVETGTFPLAHGDFARVGRLRAYGNAINQQVAAEFHRREH